MGFGVVRVLHVIPSLSPGDGGPTIAVLEMCRALGAAGVEASVVATDADGAGRLDVPVDAWTTHEGVRAHFFAWRGSRGFKFSPALARWLAGHVCDFDVVHVHAVFSHASVAAARACRRQTVPYVIRPLGTLNPDAVASRRRFGKRVIWGLAARAAVEHAAAVHFTTELERRLVEADGPFGNAVVIPLAAAPLAPAADDELAAFRVRFDVTGPFVLAMGRLHPIKAIDVLIDAFARARARAGLAEWRLVVAGDGDPAYREALQSRARGGGVVFTGWLTGVEKAAAVRNAAMVAVPSRQESFSLTAVEALSAGVPLLLSPDVGLAEEIAEAGAGWIAARQPEAFGTALERVMRDPAGRQQAGIAARRLADARFTWARVAADLRALYARIAA